MMARPGRLRENNGAVSSHLPIQRFLATYAAVCNTFNVQRHQIRRPTLRQFRAEARATWAAATRAA